MTRIVFSLLLIVFVTVHLGRAQAQTAAASAEARTWAVVVQDSRRGPLHDEQLLADLRSALEDNSRSVLEQAEVDEARSAAFGTEVLGSTQAQRLRVALRVDGLLLVSIRVDKEGRPAACALQSFTALGETIEVDAVTGSNQLIANARTRAAQLAENIDRAARDHHQATAAQPVAAGQAQRPPRAPRPIDAGSMDYLNVGLAIASGESTPSFGPHAGLVISFGKPTDTLALVAHGQLDLLMYEAENFDLVVTSSLAGGAGARLRLSNGFFLEPNLGLRIFDFIHTDGASTGVGLELGLRAVIRFGAKMGLLISLGAAPNLSEGGTSAIFRVGAVFGL